MEQPALDAAKALGNATTQYVLGFVITVLISVVVALWVKLWKVQDKYEASLVQQISNGRERNVVDQLNTQVMKALIDKQGATT